MMKETSRTPPASVILSEAPASQMGSRRITLPSQRDSSTSLGMTNPFASAFHSTANRAAANLMKLLFGCVAHIRVLRRENADLAGGYLLAANHISHFDPFIISSVVGRKIDWMAMAEFFPYPVVGQLLRAVDAFPADRDRANRKTIRTAIDRLKAGRVVGLFPEGGIRNGQRSLLEGALLRPGATTLAQIGGVPILPCVILGSDRLYAKPSWMPLRRTPIWIAFGDPVSSPQMLEKDAARQHIDRELAEAFKHLYSELRQTFQLVADDLPHSPQERMKGVGCHSKRSRVIPLPKVRSSSTGTRSAPGFARLRSGKRGDRFQSFAAKTLDAAMCASMNLLQSRHRLHSRSREEMERYIEHCEKLTVQEYYLAEPDGRIADKIGKGPGSITWRSPIETNFPENNIARADLFPSPRGWNAPTVFMLHSLMSATRIGYRRWAAHFNALGWSACFVHLPYHYSRVPRGYWNGELAITADLIRNAEGLRQGVMEVRQLMSTLRERDCQDFALLGTSYGGWIGALLAMVERNFRFVALMAPIVNVEHAIWQNPGTATMSRNLRRANIEHALVARHFHLSSPLHNQPLCRADRILFVAGEFDSIARPSDIEAIHQKWLGSELLRVRQGHFGYRMMRETIAYLEQRGL